MILTDPIIITPRLMAGVRIGDGHISIKYSPRPSRRGRTRYRYYIDIPGQKKYINDDLQSGCQSGDLQEGLSSLMSFLSSAAERYWYEQRRGCNQLDIDDPPLFPKYVVEWAYQYSDEISVLSCELEDNKELIKE